MRFWIFLGRETRSLLAFAALWPEIWRKMVIVFWLSEMLFECRKLLQVVQYWMGSKFQTSSKLFSIQFSRYGTVTVNYKLDKLCCPGQEEFGVWLLWRLFLSCVVHCLSSEGLLLGWEKSVPTSLFCSTNVGASWPPFSQLFHRHLHKWNSHTQSGCVPVFYSFSPSSKVVHDFTP